MSKSLNSLYEFAKQIGFTELVDYGSMANPPVPMPIFEYVRVLPNTIRDIHDEVLEREAYLISYIESLRNALMSTMDDFRHVCDGVGERIPDKTLCRVDHVLNRR